MLLGHHANKNNKKDKKDKKEDKKDKRDKNDKKDNQDFKLYQDSMTLADLAKMPIVSPKPWTRTNEKLPQSDILCIQQNAVKHSKRTVTSSRTQLAQSKHTIKHNDTY